MFLSLMTKLMMVTVVARVMVLLRVNLLLFFDVITDSHNMLCLFLQKMSLCVLCSVFFSPSFLFCVHFFSLSLQKFWIDCFVPFLSFFLWRERESV